MIETTTDLAEYRTIIFAVDAPGDESAELIARLGKTPDQVACDRSIAREFRRLLDKLGELSQDKQSALMAEADRAQQAADDFAKAKERAIDEITAVQRLNPSLFPSE